MTMLFVSHSPEDRACAETIRQGLEARGYNCWRDPSYLTTTDSLYLRTIGNAILGSAVFILLWDTHAAQTAWVMQHIQVAQRLKKAILLVTLDSTALPSQFAVPITTISGLASCEDAIPQLFSHLPAPDSRDLLLVLSEKAAHEYISNRRTAIALAADMLERNEHRPEVVAILEYIAQNDLMTGVREQAQEALDADKQAAAPVPPPPLLNSQDRQYMLGVRCKNCDHVTYFDRRRLCAEKRTIKRVHSSQSGNEPDAMDLPCENCGHLMLKYVDCEGL